MIYSTRNIATDSPVYYICQDQKTIDAGILAGYTGTFSIGTEEDAQAILVICQQDWLNACVDRFSVNSDIDSPDVSNATVWESCNLDTEPPNTDDDYQVFDTVNGQYILAIGLDNAKTLLAQTKQNFLIFSGLGSLTEWESFPVLPTQGLKTL